MRSPSARRVRCSVAGRMADGGFESIAEDWVKWARTPAHDSYWQFRDRFFEEIVPEPGRRTLEIGCGEGRVARDLKQRGITVFAVDASATLIGYAQEADRRRLSGGGRYGLTLR